MYCSSSPAWSCGERVAVADVGVLDAVQQHVHAADAEHGVVEVEAVEHVVVEVLRCSFASRQHLGVVLAQVLAGGDEEAGGAAGRVADHVRRACGAVISTISWMMWRGVRNWPFCPARGDLAEHVLVEVALGVAVLHRHVVEQVDDLAPAAPASGW